MEQQLKQIENGLNKIKDKSFNIYFLTQDTEGRAAASVMMNYQLVKHLRNNGYNASIMYEKTQFKGVSDWLDSEYSDLPHTTIEGGELKVGPQDFVIVPELYGHVLEQIVKMPCSKIILCQSYDYIFETLTPGTSWVNYGVTQAITTSKTQQEYIKSLMPSIKTSVVPVSIPEYFKTSNKPKKPIVAIHTRDPRDTMKIIKTFYILNPQFKWITFKDMRNMSNKEFAESLGESCVSVWVDRIAGFGTFPLESMMCETPVIGTLPILRPEWITNENGIWSFDESKIVEILGTYMKNWLEDNVPEALHEKMKETVTKISEDNQEESIVNFFNDIVIERTKEMEDALNKLTPVGENI